MEYGCKNGAWSKCQAFAEALCRAIEAERKVVELGKTVKGLAKGTNYDKLYEIIWKREGETIALEEKVKELQKKIRNQAARIRVLEGPTNHAGGIKVD